MDIDNMARELAELKAFRAKYEPMLDEMFAAYAADHPVQPEISEELRQEIYKPLQPAVTEASPLEPGADDEHEEHVDERGHKTRRKKHR